MSEELEAQQGEPEARRWPRFFARIFDVWWEELVVWYVLALTLGHYSAGFVRWINTPGTYILFGLLCLPVALFLDALIYRAFGNTPGKALIGIKVVRADTRNLSFLQYLSRNLYMWMAGLAFGLPIIFWFTMAYQSGRVHKGKPATYDATDKYLVTKQHVGWGRVSAFTVAFVCLLAIVGFERQRAQVAQSDLVANSAIQYSTWRNPLTGQTTQISSRWKAVTKTNAVGEQVYYFVGRTGHANIVLGAESAPGYSISQYVRAFLVNNRQAMQLQQPGTYRRDERGNTWLSSGAMQIQTTNRLHVTIKQVGNNFWRVVTIQAMPYGYSDPYVSDLQAKLWGTVYTANSSLQRTPLTGRR